MAVEVEAARQRIIRRPRLTAMLNESSAQIRLLIGPAGYGKTTLARQWLGEPERRDVWYRCGPASADVAALAAGIAECAAEIVPDAGQRMRDRLRATGHAEEVEILAELFAEDVAKWPSDAWLALDDYHFAMDSSASERFVEFLTRETPIQMLITSRRRPSWATARRILYSEIFEIDRRALAMEDAEARAVLARDDISSRELVARARGWPAVLGLAALADKFEVPADDVPATLHSYFAQEVFDAADPDTRRDLARLAVAPAITPALAAVVVGPARAHEVISTGVRLGVLTEDQPETFTIHPLLREVLRRQLSVDRSNIERLTEYYLNLEEWDCAFEVACEISDESLVARTFERSLDALLGAGRMATLQRWLESSLALHLDAPILDLAEAELAFRRAQHDRAYVLASQAASRLEDSNLAARAHIRAGHSALLASDERTGLQHFRLARQLAHEPDLSREAVVGLYFAASELDVPDAAVALKELEDLDERTPDGLLRLEVLRLTRATRGGESVAAALRASLPKLHLVDRATEPLGVTAYLHMLSTSLNLAARYEEALSVADQQSDLAATYRLELPIVHAQLNRAISHVGRREFRESKSALDDVARRSPPSRDAYLDAAVRVIRCRTLITQGEFDKAIVLTDDEGRLISSPPVRAEYLSYRALAFACLGQATEADVLVHEAQIAFSPSVELRVLARCIAAISSLDADSRNAHDDVEAAWQAVVETGNFDSFVCAYRADGRLLSPLLETGRWRLELGQLLLGAKDVQIARRVGLVFEFHQPADDGLTAREHDVLRELEDGASNRQIAQRLFITEATVKVHLRHIYEKFGVRSRAELLARRAKRP
jgi:LuxR family maltose regulon positive regulatory protein